MYASCMHQRLRRAVAQYALATTVAHRHIEQAAHVLACARQAAALYVFVDVVMTTFE